MADPNPFQKLYTQNIALRNILLHVVSKTATDSGDRARWLAELKASIDGIDAIVRERGTQIPEAGEMADQVAAEVNKFFKALRS